MSDSRLFGQSGEVRSFSSSVCGFGSQDSLADFPGFTDSIEDRKVLIISRRISVLKEVVCEVLEGSVGSPGFSDSFGSRRSSAPEVPPISSSFGVGLCGRVRPSGRGRLLSTDLLWWYDGDWLTDGVSLESHLPELMFWSDASDQGWGATMSVHFHSGLWSDEEACISINVWELLAVGGAPGFSPSSQGAFRSGVLRQHLRDLLSASPRRDFVSVTQRCSSVSPSLGRGSGVSSLSPICLEETQRGGGCPVPSGSGAGF